MLGSISPFGERARRQRWGVTFGAYLTGSTAAGAALGALLGAAGQGLHWSLALPDEAALGAMAAALLVALVLELRLFGLTTPTTHRQVNEDWLHRYRGWVYGLGFGLQLGLGVVTIVSTPAVYVTMAAALLSGSPLRGSLIGGTFGLVRAATLLGVAGVRRAEQVHAVDGRLWRLERTARPAAGVALAGMAVTSIVLALAG